MFFFECYMQCSSEHGINYKPIPFIPSIEIHSGPFFAVLPGGWEADVLQPLVDRFGFRKQVLEAGELTVFCRV